MFWLIERGQPEGVVPPVWYGTFAAGSEWTGDAWKAVRFSSREDADLFIERHFAGAPIVARAVEHGFVSEARATPVDHLATEQVLAWFGEPRYSVSDLQHAYAQGFIAADKDTTEPASEPLRVCAKRLAEYLEHRVGCDAKYPSLGECGCGLDALLAQPIPALRQPAPDDALRTALERLVANAVPPDALMNPDYDGPGETAHRNLYEWWHQRCAPALQEARAALVSPAAAQEDETT